MIKHIKNRYWTPTLILILVLVSLLASCGSDVVRGDEAVLVGTVYVDCGKNCRDHGSCGPSEETKKQVVLLGAEPAFPGVSTVTFKGLTAGSAVEVLDTKVVAGIEQRSNQEVQVRFYAVQDQDDPTVAGWVPGFCIANEAR